MILFYGRAQKTHHLRSHQESTDGNSISIIVVALLCRSGLIAREVVIEWGSLISIGMMTFNVIEATIIIMTFKI